MQETTSGKCAKGGGEGASRRSTHCVAWQCRDEAGEKAAVGNGAALSDDEAAPAPIRKSAFAAMTIEDNNEDDDDLEEKSVNGSSSKPAPVDEDEDDQFGGLMGAIKKSEKKGKKGKKNKKEANDDIWDELGEDISGNAAKKDDQMDLVGEKQDEGAQVATVAE